MGFIICYNSLCIHLYEYCLKAKKLVSFFLIAPVTTSVSNTRQALGQCLISNMTDSRESSLICSCWCHIMKRDISRSFMIVQSQWVAETEADLRWSFWCPETVTFWPYHLLPATISFNFMVTELSKWLQWLQTI